MNINLYRFGIAFSSFTLCFPVNSGAQIVYENVSVASGINHSYGDGFYGGGVSAVDFNNDGLEDISFATEQGKELEFYLNNGMSFNKVDPPFVFDTSEVKQILWVDYDNDGDKDLFITSYLGGNRLYENDGNLLFSDVTTISGLNFLLNPMPTFSAAFADVDNDSWLDLYVTNLALDGYANYLFKNQGNGTFIDVTNSSGVSDSLKLPFCATFFDLNNDNLQDIYIAVDNCYDGGNTLLKNINGSIFSDITSGSGADLCMDAKCVTIGDFDNDGFSDIYITNTINGPPGGMPGSALLKNNGNETFTEVATTSGVVYGEQGWGSNFLDFNNDGFLDLYVNGTHPAVASPNKLYENTGNNTFNYLSPAVSMAGDSTRSYSNAIGDFNNDGNIDIVVNNELPDSSQLWYNQNNSGNYLKIILKGTLSNLEGIGSIIFVFINGMPVMRTVHCGNGYLSQNSLINHFGVDTVSNIDSIIVNWPSGLVDKYYNVVSNAAYEAIEDSLLIPFNQLPIQAFFTDITTGSLVNHSHGNLPVLGGGISFLDINDDGLDDLFMTGDHNTDPAFYLNNGNKTFSVSNLPPGLHSPSDSKNIIWADIDNDGDKDLYVANYGQINQLFENTGSSFIDITAAAGLANNITYTFASCWGDYDLDGYIDLYVTNSSYAGGSNIRNYLYKNNGNGTFSDVTVQAGVTDSSNLPLAVSFIDYNNDLFPDIYIAMDRKYLENVLFHNNGDGTFSDVSIASGTNVLIDGMCSSSGDYDNDGDLDIYVTNSYGVPGGLNNGNVFLLNNGNGTFTDIADSIGVIGNRTGWGSNFFDYDNDGDLDLFAVYESGDSINGIKRNSLYQNNGDGTFNEVFGIGTDLDDSRTFGCAIGDLNQDGFFDIVISNEVNLNRIYLNSSNQNSWIKIALKGEISNRDGIGAWIEVYSAGNMNFRYTQAGDSYGSQSSFDQIIGLGSVSNVDSIIIKWPSGLIDKLYNLNINQKITIQEGTTSCLSQNLISVTNSKTNISCFGQNNGAIYLSTTGGFSPYRYIWDTNPEQTTNNISSLSQGFYHCYIIDDKDCIAEKELEIREPTTMLTFYIPNNPSGPGMGDGAIDLLVSGGVVPYTYLWSNGKTTEDVSNLSAGTYYVTIIDRNGCAALLAIPLTDGGSLKLHYRIKEFKSSEDCENRVSLFASGGKAPYLYSCNSVVLKNSLNQSLDRGSNLISVVDASGSSVQEEILVSNCKSSDGSSLSAPSDALVAVIYPNPVSEKATISVQCSANYAVLKIRLIDALGRVVFAENVTCNKGQNEWVINTKKLSSGIYWMELSSLDIKQAEQLIVDNN